MKKIYHIEPVFTAALWGGQQLIQDYGYQSSLSNIGECYNVIALPDHLDCRVLENGQTLSAFYQDHRELFGCPTEYMPVRAAMACTKEAMSVQLHPSNDYALAHEGKLGKPDGVYVIKGNGKVCFGHNAKTKDEFIELAEKGAWEKLLRYVAVQAGDFLDMPFGTIHALGANMVYIEFSQNADLTYRLYDYDRQQKDPKTGKPRVLHRQQVYDCVRIPDNQTAVSSLQEIVERGCSITAFHSEPGLYSCGKIQVSSRGIYQREEFYFLTCLAGAGKIANETIKAGETVFVPCDFGELLIEGDLTLTYLTYEERKGVE